MRGAAGNVVNVALRTWRTNTHHCGVVARASRAQMPVVVAGNKSMQKPGHPIIVFLANNQIAAATVNAAANMARAGRDTLMLVTIVPSDMQKTAGEEMLAVHRRAALRSMAEVTTHVVVRRTAGLLECIERVVADATQEQASRPLVVMGSIQLTSSVFSYMASSVTLSAIKRLAGTPVMVVTLNSKQARSAALWAPCGRPWAGRARTHRWCVLLVSTPRLTAVGRRCRRGRG